MKDYKKILENVVNIINTTEKSDIGFANICTYIGENCPELAESDDERIRRDIIRYLKKTSPAIGENIEKMLAWLEKQGEFYTKRDVDNAYIEGMAFAKDELEKQGEQKPVFEMKTPEKSLGIDSDTYNKIVDECIYGDGEQKPADKIEPKFHEGEWVVWKDKCYKVNYNGCGYELVDQDGLSTSLEYGTIDENAHIWDVTTDAKDGDVLISRYNKPFIYNGNWNSLNIGSYCGITTEGMFNVATEKCYWTGNVNIHPATKEQRDILFQKMREASYEWDAEKKELKKINSYCQENCKGFQEIGKCFTDGECKAKREAEQKPTDNEMKEALRTEYEKGRADAIAEMQKPAWSKEDMSKVQRICKYLNEAKKYYADTTEVRDCMDWLKSLKDRYTWKPSDEQMEVLLSEVSAWTKGCPKQIVLESLYNDLKKLTEE